MSHPISEEPDRMTARAQLYLGVEALRHVLLGLVATLAPQTFTSSSYGFIASPGSRTEGVVIWGVVFLGVGVAAAAAAATRSERLAHAALFASIFVTGCWVGGLLEAGIRGTLTTPSGPIIWGALLLKDAIMLRNPLRDPFALLSKKIAAS